MSRATQTAHPVRTHDAFRWLLSGAGFWLCLSPYLLFSTDRLIAGEVTPQTMALMGLGFGALVVAGLTHGQHVMVQTAAAILLAVGLATSPWLVGFLTHSTAAINAWVTSGLIVLGATHLQSLGDPQFRRHRKKAHQFRPVTFI